MKKIIKLENLDCAACANKMEEMIHKINGVKEVSVNFLTQKIKLEIDGENYDTIIMEIKKVIKRVEPECKILDK